MSEGSSFIQQHSAFVYNKRMSLLRHPRDKDRLQADNFTLLLSTNNIFSIAIIMM